MTTKKIVLVVGGVVVVLALIVVCFAVGIAGLAWYHIGKSEAAARSKDFLRNSEKLKADIGPVKDFGRLVEGTVSLGDSHGNATLYFRVIGERKTVEATVELVLVQGGAWRVSSASYVNESGLKIDLLDPYDASILIPRLIA